MGEVWPDGTGVKTTEEVSKLCARIAELERWQREAAPALASFRAILADPDQPQDWSRAIRQLDALLAEAGRSE